MAVLVTGGMNKLQMKLKSAPGTAAFGRVKLHQSQNSKNINVNTVITLHTQLKAT
jgi:hypothetical protein